MARLQNLGDTDDWFIGEDKTLEFEIYDSTEALIQNVTGWAMLFRLRRISESDAVLFTKTTGGSTITIAGTYNADPTVNAQRTSVVIDDTDTDNLQPGKYAYWLWRTDSGNETVLAYGDVTLKRAG